MMSGGDSTGCTGGVIGFTLTSVGRGRRVAMCVLRARVRAWLYPMVWATT